MKRRDLLVAAPACLALAGPAAASSAGLELVGARRAVPRDPELRGLMGAGVLPAPNLRICNEGCGVVLQVPGEHGTEVWYPLAGVGQWVFERTLPDVRDRDHLVGHIRFPLGSGDLVRVYFDPDAVPPRPVVHLPQGPGAAPYTVGYTFEEYTRIDGQTYCDHNPIRERFLLPDEEVVQEVWIERGGGDRECYSIHVWRETPR